MLQKIKASIGHRNLLRLIWHKAKAFLAALYYRFPARSLTVIGVTGTDGKTTTVGMIAHVLHETGYSVGALSTAYIRIGNHQEWNETHKTSPSPFLTQQFLRRCVNSGCTHVVMEYSSHGLVQGRTDCTWPSIAAITNTSKEHLDYHGTMEQYRKDKSILFRMLHGKGTKVLHLDDETFTTYKDIPSSSTITWSTKRADADMSLKNVHLSPTESSATVLFEGEEFPLHLSVLGSFNIENALCALSVTVPLCGLSQACTAFSTFRGTPGRMEPINEGQKFTVIVDYTVTPASYTKTLSTLREMLPETGKLLVLTGSCGDRMKEKRPIVGRICSELADTVVVTNEDPFTEDPQNIIDEVWSGIDQTQCNAKQIFDRKEAIQWLLDQANPEDIVILCAKGSDTTMWVKEGQIPWNERAIVRELLQESYSTISAQ